MPSKCTAAIFFSYSRLQDNIFAHDCNSYLMYLIFSLGIETGFYHFLQLDPQSKRATGQ